MGEVRQRINVVLFSGGSGTQSITEAFLRHPQIRLRILINAYDDGHSTGRLRKFVPGMLGPSDVRKNLNRLMPVDERCQKSLKYLSDWRLPVGIERGEALALIGNFVAGEAARLPGELADPYRMLSVAQADEFRALLSAFLQFLHAQEANGRTFDFTDCALGNLLFTGCFLSEGRDFNRAIDAFSRFYEVSPGTLLNITAGENLFLSAAKEDGATLLTEADIVNAQTSTKISDLYLIEEGTYRAGVEGRTEPDGGWLPLLRSGARTPLLNPSAGEAIAEADVIVYGPGTQHSSLFPSYMTEGLGEAIARNREADKIFIGNIVRDNDIQEDDISDLARKFMRAMSRQGSVAIEWRDCVSQFFVQRSEEASSARYIPFDPSKFAYPLDTVRLKDWEWQDGRHSGGFVLDELQQVVQSRIDVELQQIQHMVSIVVPVLNEERTLPEALKSLLVLDFAPLNMTKEIIVVDGCSTDRSFAIARAVRTVRAYRLPARLGRGAALRMGVDKARGSIVAFFPGDREYRTADLYSLVAQMREGRFQAAFGTRAIKVRSLSAQLKDIYGGQRSLYLTSKYGGMALSIVTLLLYNRYITDVLTSLKVFNARLLRSLRLECNGRDLDTEIIAKLGLRHEYIFEMPVDYFPRSRNEGKKITLADGLRALAGLFRYRVSRRARAASEPGAEGVGAEPAAQKGPM
jgi:2-phospho-L-lactate transferase/gluconeogenesis factor (CofD/UPF0052 family)